MNWSRVDRPHHDHKQTTTPRAWVNHDYKHTGSTSHTTWSRANHKYITHTTSTLNTPRSVTLTVSKSHDHATSKPRSHHTHHEHEYTITTSTPRSCHTYHAPCRSCGWRHEHEHTTIMSHTPRARANHEHDHAASTPHTHTHTHTHTTFFCQIFFSVRLFRNRPSRQCGSLSPLEVMGAGTPRTPHLSYTTRARAHHEHTKTPRARTNHKYEHTTSTLQAHQAHHKHERTTSTPHTPRAQANHEQTTSKPHTHTTSTRKQWAHRTHHTHHEHEKIPSIQRRSRTRVNHITCKTTRTRSRYEHGHEQITKNLQTTSKSNYRSNWPRVFIKTDYKIIQKNKNYQIKTPQNDEGNKKNKYTNKSIRLHHVVTKRNEQNTHTNHRHTTNHDKTTTTTTTIKSFTKQKISSRTTGNDKANA